MRSLFHPLWHIPCVQLRLRIVFHLGRLFRMVPIFGFFVDELPDRLSHRPPIDVRFGDGDGKDRREIIAMGCQLAGHHHDGDARACLFPG